MNDTPEQSPEQGLEPSLSSQYVARYLTRLGVPQSQRLKLTEEALGVAYHQARRRIRGAPWSLEELEKLAIKLGGKLQDVLADESPTPLAPAVLVLGVHRFECMARIGDELSPASQDVLVAIKTVTDQLEIVLGTEVGGLSAYEVLDLHVLTPSQLAKPKVAVLDDDADLATSVAESMSLAGIQATPFFNVASLRGALETTHFDGYVVDWYLQGESSKALIAEIRTKDRDCPIVVLTGQTVGGGVVEAELRAFASSYLLTYYEKPATAYSIMSALQLGFRQGLRRKQNQSTQS